MKNASNEWCVAYHGVGSRKETKDITEMVSGIASQGLKAGPRQAHENCDDIYHKNQKVGKGIYCTPKIEVAEAYCGICNVNGKKYKVAFMLRIRPNPMRGCNCPDAKDYWVVNSCDSRAYRILIKEIE